MASLRARLIAALLAVAAVGLLVLGGVTYAEQRSFLLTRVDAAARNAFGPVDFALDQAGYNRPGYARAGDGQPPAPADDHGGHGPSPYTYVPPGTYGQRRYPDGTVIGGRFVFIPRTYTGQTPAVPKLPANIPVGKIITVGSVGDSGLRYRVLARPTGDQPGSTIAALPLRETDQALHQLLIVLALVIGGVLAALGVLAWFVVRLGLRPLDRIGQTAGAIAAGDLSRRVRPATPKTEVGRLGISLNKMLGRLEQAFAERQASEDRLRRFISDASHELRTPLASIRGYAELFRIGAKRNEEDTAKAMRRIEDEAARMGVLVEDLLTLARLDELPSPAQREVDVAAVARDGAEDARAIAPDRHITVDAQASALVLGDSHQLRQVLANLLRNALEHTPDGSPIEVSVARDNGDVRLEVRDHGPGLPTSEADALFERFWRTEGGRERGKGGAGLGLAIVAGIVEAHGGRVHAANAVDGGARFTVRLPAAHEMRPRSETSQDELSPL